MGLGANLKKFSFYLRSLAKQKECDDKFFLSYLVLLATKYFDGDLNFEFQSFAMELEDEEIFSFEDLGNYLNISYTYGHLRHSPPRPPGPPAIFPKLFKSELESRRATQLFKCQSTLNEQEMD